MRATVVRCRSARDLRSTLVSDAGRLPSSRSVTLAVASQALPWVVRRRASSWRF